MRIFAVLAPAAAVHASSDLRVEVATLLQDRVQEHQAMLSPRQLPELRRPAEPNAATTPLTTLRSNSGRLNPPDLQSS
jgi:hypothetical protein